MKQFSIRLGVLPLVLLAACVGSSKSSNPLSPTVAGPIAGVDISAPTVVAPPIDALVDTTTQPITLRVGNATSTGVRPLSYAFEIATDPNFTNKVLTRDNVPQDASGVTALTLPQALAAERKYYWHARAEDGANASAFGATSAFSIFTPVVFGTPVLLSPINGITTSSSQPELVIGNAARSGPAGTIFYYIELSTSGGFNPLFAAYTIPEEARDSELVVPVALPADQYFWRARVFDDLGHSGPFSAAQSFRSPGGSGGGGVSNPGQPCGPPYPNTHKGILECRRSQYPYAMSDADRVAFLRGSAQDFNAAGLANGPFGILVKTSGANCNGYSCDIICAGHGGAQRQWDVLVGIPGSPVTWREVDAPVTVRVCEIQ